MAVSSCETSPGISKWLIAFGFLITTVVSWVLRDYGAPVLEYSPVDQCLPQTNTTSAEPVDTSCLGQSAVLRIAFGNFMFFALHTLVLLGVTRKDNFRTPVFTGFWPIRLVLWAGLIGACFAMPSSVFDPPFIWISRLCAGIFIVFQLLILLDFIYALNEWLLSRDDALGNALLIGGSVVLMAGSLVGTGFLYHVYAPKSSCSLNIFFITWNLILFLMYTGLSVSPLRNESAGLLTSACTFGYCTYYVWSALNSQPLENNSCISNAVGGNNVIQIIGFILALLAVSLSTANSGSSSSSFALSGSIADVDDDDLPFRPDFFCFIFLLASCYMAVILTGWDTSSSDDSWSIDSGWGSTWVKIVASWLCAIFYTWSLIAHRVFDQREF